MFFVDSDSLLVHFMVGYLFLCFCVFFVLVVSGLKRSKVRVSLGKRFQIGCCQSVSMFSRLAGNQKVKTKGRANVRAANKSFKPTALRASA